MTFHGRFLGFLLAYLVLLVPCVLAVERNEIERAHDPGDLPIDVVYTDKAKGVTARIPWDSSIFPTIIFLKSIRADYKLKTGSLVFLIEDLNYTTEDPRRYGVLIARDFDVNHGNYYHLTENYVYKHGYRLVTDYKYDMTDRATKHRIFVGVLDSNRDVMERFLAGQVPYYDADLSKRPKRPSLDEEEDMTDENFLSDYREIRKEERDSEREVEKYKKLDRLKEEYRDRLPKDGSDPVTLEYFHKTQEIEDEYLDSLELPERDLVESRPVEDDEFWDSFENSTPQEELAAQRAQKVDTNWAHAAMAEAVRQRHIRPGEEFHVFAL